jgi:hypothetical protein
MTAGGGGDVGGGAVAVAAAVTVDAGLADAVSDGVTDAVVVAGDGLAADAHAAITRPMTMTVAIHEIEERIPGPLEGVDGRTLGDACCYGSMIVVV